MKVLHINVSAIRDRFYLSLFTYLKKCDIVQTVFTPYRKEEYNDNEFLWVNCAYKNSDIELILLPIKTIFDRLFYKHKINKYVKTLISITSGRNFDLIHAHSLFTDGGVAFEYCKQTKHSYIVAVRTTDLEYLCIFPYLKKYARKILLGANKIIYISPDIKDSVYIRVFSGKYKRDGIICGEKTVVLPNGVNDFWLDNMCKEKVAPTLNNVNLIQVSRLEPRKNVFQTVLAVDLLKKRGIKVHLDIVGEGKQFDKIRNIIQAKGLQDNVSMFGFISDKNHIRSLYRKAHIFVMPSERETFGITYIEAITQGLPVIGLKGTGVSGYFNNGIIGKFVKKATPVYIANAVIDIVKNYSTYSNSCIEKAPEFRWDRIIGIYVNIYKNIYDRV